MPTNKNRVMFLCDDEARNDLRRWAEQERRSISNLVEKIVLEAIADWKQQQPPAPAPPPEPSAEKEEELSPRGQRTREARLRRQAQKQQQQEKRNE